MPTLSDFLARFSEVESETDGGFIVPCPSHSDSRPSLRVALSEGKEGGRPRTLLHCRAGCETRAVMEALGLTREVRDASTGEVRTVPDWAALPSEPGQVETRPITARVAAPGTADVAALAVRLDTYAAALKAEGAHSAAALAYAEDRFGITPDEAFRLGLGVAADLGEGPRLVVPFRDREGRPRGFQARALTKEARVRWTGPKNPEGATWGKVAWLPGSSGWEEVLVTEGPGDALTGVGLGYDTVGIRGAALASNPAVLAEVASLVGDREAVIAGDGDPAGRRFSATLAEGLANLNVRVRILDVPDGVDLSDWRKRSPQGFAREVVRAIAEAKPVQSRTAALMAWDEDRYSLTDLGGARYLRDDFEARGSGIRYSEEVGFFILDRGVWVRDDLQAVRTHAQRVADFVRKLADDAAEDLRDGESSAKARAGRLRRYSAHVQTTRGLDSMLRELQAVEGVPASVADFDRHPDLLAVRNGVVHLKTGELRPHDPSLLLTRRVDLDYRPDAQAPTWERFLGQVFPSHPDLPDYVRRLVGYGITGHTVEQCFAVLWGTGSNGKSVFTDTLTSVFRAVTVTTPFSTFEAKPSGGIPNDLAALKGARLVMASEGDQGRPMAEAVIKRVTGRDLISARFMRKEFFEFAPTFLIFLATNYKPAFRGQDEGLWRRVKLIPWDRYFAPHERDHYLGEKLLRESEGILAWAVRGAVEWYRDGLRDPAVVIHSTKEYRETSDALAGFFPGVLVRDEEGSIPGSDAYDLYREWTEDEGLQGKERWTRRTFYGALEERGASRVKRNTGVFLMGIRKALPGETVEATEAASRASGASPAHLPGASTTTPQAPSLDDVEEA